MLASMNLRSTGKLEAPKRRAHQRGGGKDGSLSFLLLSLQRLCICLFEIFRDRRGPCRVLDWRQLPSLPCFRAYAVIASNALTISNCKSKASTADGQPLRISSRRRRRRRHGDDTDKTLGKKLPLTDFFSLLAQHSKKKNSLPPRHCRDCSSRGCDRHGAPRGTGRQVRERSKSETFNFKHRAFFRRRRLGNNSSSPLNLFLTSLLSHLSKNTPPPPPPPAPATAASAPTSPSCPSSPAPRPTSARPRPRSRACPPASRS